ncbi:hypothetical protein BDR04DRAFT_1101800 [Suillus decipiens]|nr:hypothetical protein BDR04DRAFT_1101800 [Suillus decipiens]
MAPQLGTLVLLSILAPIFPNGYIHVLYRSLQDDHAILRQEDPVSWRGDHHC